MYDALNYARELRDPITCTKKNFVVIITIFGSKRGSYSFSYENYNLLIKNMTHFY